MDSFEMPESSFNRDKIDTLQKRVAALESKFSILGENSNKKTWKDHIPKKERGGLLAEYDDGSAVLLSAYSGGGSKDGVWGAMSLMSVNAEGVIKFRRFEATTDWICPEVELT
jgi:hypothetical protein